MRKSVQVVAIENKCCTSYHGEKNLIAAYAILGILHIEGTQK